MAQPVTPQVFPVRPADYGQAGEMLARVFLDDPLWTAVMPDAETRPGRLAGMFTAGLKTSVPAGGIVEATPGLEAIAQWLPPGKKFGLWSMIRSGFAVPRWAMTMPRQDRRRMMELFSELEHWRKELLPDSYWYLLALGVDPAHQGKGMGTRLLRSGLARAGSTPVYLETEIEGNVAYYEHRGFEVIVKRMTGSLGVPMWLMIRRPQ